MAVRVVEIYMRSFLNSEKNYFLAAYGRFSVLARSIIQRLLINSRNTYVWRHSSAPCAPFSLIQSAYAVSWALWRYCYILKLYLKSTRKLKKFHSKNLHHLFFTTKFCKMSTFLAVSCYCTTESHKNIIEWRTLCNTIDRSVQWSV